MLPRQRLTVRFRLGLTRNYKMWKALRKDGLSLALWKAVRKDGISLAVWKALRKESYP